MEQNRAEGFFWALISRGDNAQQLQRERAQWEPVYMGPQRGTVVLGVSQDWSIWELGPRIPTYEGGLPRGAFDGK